MLAATNRADMLDAAIVRPGRFDRRVSVGLPDTTGRRAILEVHAKDKPLDESVDLDHIAKRCAALVASVPTAPSQWPRPNGPVPTAPAQRPRPNGPVPAPPAPTRPC